MKNVRIVSHKQKIDAVFAHLKNLPDDEECRAHWAKYICVLVSGFLEQSIKVIVTDYVEKRSSKEVGHFVSEHLKQFSNAKMKKLLSVLEQFDPELSKRFEAETMGKLADAVNSVVVNRHQIAHGGQGGVSPARMREWYNAIVLVVDKLESHLA
jgi:hypothetical protein